VCPYEITVGLASQIFPLILFVDYQSALLVKHERITGLPYFHGIEGLTFLLMRQDSTGNVLDALFKGLGNGIDIRLHNSLDLSNRKEIRKRNAECHCHKGDCGEKYEARFYAGQACHTDISPFDLQKLDIHNPVTRKLSPGKNLWFVIVEFPGNIFFQYQASQFGIKKKVIRINTVSLIAHPAISGIDTLNIRYFLGIFYLFNHVNIFLSSSHRYLRRAELQN
jgi:hypothetical protein